MTLDEAVKKLERMVACADPDDGGWHTAIRTLLAAVRPEKKSPGRVVSDVADRHLSRLRMSIPPDISDEIATTVLRECAVQPEDVTEDDVADLAYMIQNGTPDISYLRGVIRRIAERKGQ